MHHSNGVGIRAKYSVALQYRLSCAKVLIMNWVRAANILAAEKHAEAVVIYKDISPPTNSLEWGW